MAAAASTEEIIEELNTAVKGVKEDGYRDKKLRALRVMSILRNKGRPDLWEQVCHLFVDDGELDMSEVLGNTNVRDLILLSSEYAECQITKLILSGNVVFGGEDEARQVGVAFASGNLSQLRRLYLNGCELSDNSLGHIVDGITRGCTGLTWLGLDRDNLTDSSLSMLRGLLQHLPALAIDMSMSVCPLSGRSCFEPLRQEFRGRFLLPPTDEMIEAIKAAATPVVGESDEDTKLRALHVMSMLKEDGMPVLWQHVSHRFVYDGWLDMSSVLQRTNLPDFIFVLSSQSSAGQITTLILYGNDILGGDDGARQLGVALGLGSLSRLRELNLYGCELSDNSLCHIVDGITRGCTGLTWLGLTIDNLTAASQRTLRRLLEELPEVKIRLWPWQSWVDQLYEEFPGRFY